MLGIESRTLNLPGKCPTSKLPSLCNVAIRKLKSIFIYLLMRVERHNVAYTWRKRTSCVNRFSPSNVWTPGITPRLGGRSLSHLSPLASKLELNCMAPVSYLSYIVALVFWILQSIIRTEISLKIEFVSWLWLWKQNSGSLNIALDIASYVSLGDSVSKF